MTDRFELTFRRTAKTTLVTDWKPPAAGTLAAAFVGWWSCFDSLRLITLFGLFGFAAKYVVLAFFSCGLTFAFIHWLFSRNASMCLRHSLLSSLLIAAWVPSLALYLDQKSTWTLVPAMTVGVIWTIAARAHADAVSEPADVPVHFPHATIISAPGSIAWTPDLRNAFAASVLLQSSLALVIAGEPVLAVPAGSMAASILAASWYASGPRAGQSCASLKGCASLAVFLTAASVSLTAAALLPHLARSTMPVSEGIPELLPPSRPAENAVSPEINDIHSGVIIWPEMQPHAILVPPLPSMAPAFGHTREETPLSIPFFGVYWIYRPPHRQPPPNSLVIRGNPVDRRLRSTDRVRLKMEARQNFGALVPMDCCRSIELVVRNGDRYGGTVALELFLGNTTQIGKPSQSLGKFVLPWPRHSPGSDPGDSQRLSFPMPTSGPLRQFDDAVVVFHLEAIRADEAARVAVERFVLVPRLF